MHRRSALTWLRLGFLVFWLALFIGAAIVARQHPPAIGRFPFYVSVAGAILVALDALLFLRNPLRSGQDESGDLKAADGQDDARSLVRATKYMAWMGALLVMIRVIPYALATAVFVAAFYLLEAKTTWRTAVTASLVATTVIFLLSTVLALRWPESLIGF
jgi:hypothetical protein